MSAFPEEPVTRRRAGVTVDPYQPRSGGSPDWSKATDTPIGFLSFAPVRSSNVRDPDRDPTETRAAFYGSDPCLDVLQGDRLVRSNGEVYTVAGRPDRWGHGAGWPCGIVIPAEIVEEGAHAKRQDQP